MTIALLIPLLPLLASFVIGVLGKRLGHHVSNIGIFATVSACLLSIFTLFTVSVGNPIHITLWPFADESSTFFYIRHISRPSHSRHDGTHHECQHRYSCLFRSVPGRRCRLCSILCTVRPDDVSSFLSLVSSPNLLMLFVFWQLLSWTLYLILAF